jgi:hypothetical protein
MCVSQLSTTGRAIAGESMSPIPLQEWDGLRTESTGFRLAAGIARICDMMRPGSASILVWAIEANCRRAW